MLRCPWLCTILLLLIPVASCARQHPKPRRSARTRLRLHKRTGRWWVLITGDRNCADVGEDARLMDEAECRRTATAIGLKFMGKTHAPLDYPGCVVRHGGIEFNAHKVERSGCSPPVADAKHDRASSRSKIRAASHCICFTSHPPQSSAAASPWLDVPAETAPAPKKPRNRTADVLIGETAAQQLEFSRGHRSWPLRAGCLQPVHDIGCILASLSLELCVQRCAETQGWCELSHASDRATTPSPAYVCTNTACGHQHTRHASHTTRLCTDGARIHASPSRTHPAGVLCA